MLILEENSTNAALCKIKDDQRWREKIQMSRKLGKPVPKPPKLAASSVDDTQFFCGETMIFLWLDVTTAEQFHKLFCFALIVFGKFMVHYAWLTFLI